MRERVTFEHLLSALQHSHTGADRDPAESETFANPLANAALPIQDEAPDPGVADLWDLAAAWAPDSEPDEAPRSPAPSDEVEAIARELDLAHALAREEILRARRLFMWKYHPDRRPDVSVESAGQRVAIANMLVDRALEALSNRKSTALPVGGG